MNPELQLQSPNHYGRNMLITGLLTVGALGAAACSESSHADTASTTSTEAAATSTSTSEVAGAGDTPILPGDDATIAAEANITRCGADGSLGPWDRNNEPRILNAEANQDLLRSKEQVMFEKIGFNAANILATTAFTYDGVDSKFQDSDSLYTRLLARATPVQMNDEGVKLNPIRQNFRCDDQDNDGIGDESIFRDNRANINNGVNTTLLALTLTPEDWQKASDAAAAEGITLSDQIMIQHDNITVKDKDGKEITLGVVHAFFEDDSCGNQVFVAPPPPETPGDTTTTGPNSPTTTGPNTTTPAPTTTVHITPKTDTGTIPTIPGADPAESDKGTPGQPGVGPAGQTPDTAGVVPGEAPVSTQALTPTTIEAAPSTSVLPTATTGVAPTSTNPPATSPINPTPTNPEVGPLPTAP